MKQHFQVLTFLRNLKWAFKRNSIEDYMALECRVEKLERRVELANPDALEFKSLLLLEEVLNCVDPQFKDEVAYCRRHRRLSVFPYKQIRAFPNVEVHFDSGRKLQYVLHGGKRLYYPSSWGRDSIAFSYTNSVAVEGILGQGCLEKSPHNYIDNRFPVKDGSVVCDFGAAEGLVGLHFAERASRIVIGECDEKWKAPLEATFAPWSKKTIFIAQPLGMGLDAAGGIQPFLEDGMAANANTPFFIKFDIEGAERFAIREASHFFQTRSDVTVACAAYHRQDDAELLEKMFKAWGYTTVFSAGAMLFLLDTLVPPFFRRGVLFAKKNPSFHLSPQTSLHDDV